MKNLLVARAPKAFHLPGLSALSTSSSPSPSALATAPPAPPPLPPALPLPPPPPAGLFGRLLDFLEEAVSKARLLASSTPSTRAMVWPVAVLVSRPRMCQHAGSDRGLLRGSSPASSSPFSRRANGDDDDEDPAEFLEDLAALASLVAAAAAVFVVVADLFVPPPPPPSVVLFIHHADGDEVISYEASPVAKTIKRRNIPRFSGESTSSWGGGRRYIAETWSHPASLRQSTLCAHSNTVVLYHNQHVTAAQTAGHAIRHCRVLLSSPVHEP